MGETVTARPYSLPALVATLFVSVAPTPSWAQVQRRANPSETRRVAITPAASDQTVCFLWDDATQRCNKVPITAPFDLAFPAPGSITVPALAPLQEWYLSMDFSNKGYCEAVRCVTEVRVDPNYVVHETNENNNTVTRGIE